MCRIGENQENGALTIAVGVRGLTGQCGLIMWLTGKLVFLQRILSEFVLVNAFAWEKNGKL